MAAFRIRVEDALNPLGAFATSVMDVGVRAGRVMTKVDREPHSDMVEAVGVDLLTRVDNAQVTDFSGRLKRQKRKKSGSEVRNRYAGFRVSADGNIAEWLFTAHTSLGGYGKQLFHLSEFTVSGWRSESSQLLLNCPRWRMLSSSESTMN